MGTVLSYMASADLDSTINTLSLTTVGIAAVLLVIFVVLSLTLVKKWPKVKLPLFLAIAITVVGSTIIIAGGTVYLNTHSFTGGPIHWHADFEIWACGNEVDLRDPTGLSNKIGTPTLHEHNDKRIHLEGVPITPKDASLGNFMDVVGGQLTGNTLIVPLNDSKYFYDTPSEEDGDGNGAPAPELVTPFIHTRADGKVAAFVNGQKCGDQTAQVQVFVYQYNQANDTYSQMKVKDPANYSITGNENVPPGDCVIMQFGPATDRTPYLCKQYGIRDKDKCGEFGVPPDQRKVCTMTEVK